MAAAATLLVLVAPLMIVIALCVRLGSAGPVLFRQTRAGRGGKHFTLLKFRTMRIAKKQADPGFHPGVTDRVTRLGRPLRATKLDELPSLWNVLIGEMSLVGPRPEAAAWIAPFASRWTLVHQAAPGITCSASILFHDEERILVASDSPEELYRNNILPRKLALYEDYVANASAMGDLKILWRTAATLLRPGRAKPV